MGYRAAELLAFHSIFNALYDYDGSLLRYHSPNHMTFQKMPQAPELMDFPQKNRTFPFRKDPGYPGASDLRGGYRWGIFRIVRSERYPHASKGTRRQTRQAPGQAL